MGRPRRPRAGFGHRAREAVPAETRPGTGRRRAAVLRQPALPPARAAIAARLRKQHPGLPVLPGVTGCGVARGHRGPPAELRVPTSTEADQGSGGDLRREPSRANSLRCTTSLDGNRIGASSRRARSSCGRTAGTTEPRAPLRGSALLNARSSNVKWLLPDAYRVWRSVGLGGYTKGGLPDPPGVAGTTGGTSRSRTCCGRAACGGAKPARCCSANYLPPAVTEYCPAPGLRMPSPRDARGTSGCHRSACRPSTGTVHSTRAMSILRAQSAGRYDHMQGRRDRAERGPRAGRPASRTNPGTSLRCRWTACPPTSGNACSFEGERGLEPAMLWLSESGMPMHFDTWKMVFHEANRRCEALGVGIHCYPHMLRHSFALRWWAISVGRRDRSPGERPARASIGTRRSLGEGAAPPWAPQPRDDAEHLPRTDPRSRWTSN